MLIFKCYRLWLKIRDYLLLLYYCECLALDSFKLLLPKVRKKSCVVIYGAWIIPRIILFLKWCLLPLEGPKSYVKSMTFINILFHFEGTEHLNSINKLYMNERSLDLTGKLSPVSPTTAGDKIFFKVKRIE